jgi:hypothetical protein
VSVSDVGAIAACSDVGIVQAEIQAGVLLSQLASSGVCPHFLQTYQVSRQQAQALAG